MYCTKKIASDLVWVGANDRRLAMFEGVYSVPAGVSYNSYLLTDEKTVLFDTVDKAVSRTFFENLEHELGGRPLDYVIVHHMEPDHSATLSELLLRHPETTVVCNDKTAVMIAQFFGKDAVKNMQLVKEGDVLSAGAHELTFYLAPMIHWPEVMMTYDKSAHTLFTADAFGVFGALNGAIFADEVDFDRDYLKEARRYYTNIVGKYGVQVQGLLKKAAALEIRTICPLHGPQLSGEALDRALTLYGLWAAWKPEQSGVLVAYASFHGHTAEAAKLLAEKLHAQGETVEVIDLNRVHKSYAVSAAFKYDRMALCATTYDSAYAPAMEAFLSSLKLKGMQGRKVALVENGTWAPMAAKHMRAVLDTMKNMQTLDRQVTIRSAMNAKNREELAELAQALAL